jgi:hypothetical protein
MKLEKERIDEFVFKKGQKSRKGQKRPNRSIMEKVRQAFSII